MPRFIAVPYWTALAASVFVAAMLTAGCGGSISETSESETGESPSRVYRFADALERDDESVSAETRLTDPAEIDTIGVDVRLASARPTRVTLYLVRTTHSGGERLPLTRQRAIEGRWSRRFEVDRFQGASMQGRWGLELHADSPRTLVVDALRLEFQAAPAAR